jgi:flavin-dependent dehydrogenase
VSAADILVVGGGPAGSVLAALAAGAGARVTVVERRVFPRDKVCGEFVSVEGQGVLSRVGALDTLLDAGATSMGAVRITSAGGREVSAPLPDLPAIGRYALGVSRSLLDEVLLERAGRAGALVEHRVEAVAPVIEDDRVVGMQVRDVGSRGAGRTIRAAVVAAADGRGSVLARSLHPELGDPTRSRPRSWFGLKIHLDLDPGRLDGQVQLHLFDGGYAGVGSVENGRVNLCLLTTVEALRACGGAPDRLLRERILANPSARDLLAGAEPLGPWSSVGPLRFGVRRPIRAGALFVGDAAGTIDPFSGEGIAHALRGGEMALEPALAGAESGGLSEQTAVAYREAWTAAFAPATRRVRLLGRLLEHPRLAGALVATIGRTMPGLFSALVGASRTGLAALPRPD